METNEDWSIKLFWDWKRKHENIHWRFVFLDELYAPSAMNKTPRIIHFRVLHEELWWGYPNWMKQWEERTYGGQIYLTKVDKRTICKIIHLSIVKRSWDSSMTD